MAEQKYLDKEGLSYALGLLKTKFDGKLDSLTAGTGITINNNVISAEAASNVINLNPFTDDPDVLTIETISENHARMSGSIIDQATIMTILGLDTWTGETIRLFESYKKSNPIMVQDNASGKYIIDASSVTYDGAKIYVTFATEVVLSSTDYATSYQCGKMIICCSSNPYVQLSLDLYMGLTPQDIVESPDSVILLDFGVLESDNTATASNSYGEYNEQICTFKTASEDVFYEFIGDATKSISARDCFDKFVNSNVYLSVSDNNGVNTKFGVNNISLENGDKIVLQQSVVTPECTYKGDNHSTDFEFIINFGDKTVTALWIDWADIPSYSSKAVLVKVDVTDSVDAETGDELVTYSLKREYNGSWLCPKDIYKLEHEGYRVEYYAESKQNDPETEQPKKLFIYLTHTMAKNDELENSMNLCSISVDSLDSYGHYPNLCVYHFPENGLIIYNSTLNRFEEDGYVENISVQRKLTAGSGITIENNVISAAASENLTLPLHFHAVLTRIGPDFWIDEAQTKGYYECDLTGLMGSFCGQLNSELSKLLSLSQQSLQSAILNTVMYKKPYIMMQTRNASECTTDVNVIPIWYSDDDASFAYLITMVSQMYTSDKVATITIQLVLPWDGPSARKSSSKLILKYELTASDVLARELVDNVLNSSSLVIVTDESGVSSIEVKPVEDDSIQNIVSTIFGGDE